MAFSNSNITATVLFVEDLNTCMMFYRDVVGLKPTFNDDVSYGFQLGNQDFIVLQHAAAAKMVTAEAMGKGSSHSALLCVGVEDVDAEYKALTAKGVTFINPPIDQAWGRRTASESRSASL